MLSVPCSLVINCPRERPIPANSAVTNSSGPEDVSDVIAIGHLSRPQMSEKSSSFREVLGLPLPSQALTVAASAEPKLSRILPARPVVHELVNLYFRLIHNCPHTLFHVPTILGDLGGVSIPELIVLSMMALSARYLAMINSVIFNF